MTFSTPMTIPSAIQHTCQRADKAQQPAIVLDEQQITYAQLLHRAQALATHLRVVHDIRVGDIIAQCVERSIEMSVGMVGIMLTGAIYCPLNPGDPLERLLTIVKETRARVILTHSLTEHKFSDLVTVNIPDDDHLYSSGEELPPVCVDPRSVAYIISTSGTTGKPKTVQITHNNFFNSLNGYNSLKIYCYGMNRLLQMARCSFDLHILESLGPLIHGSICVMLKPNGNLDLAYVASTIARHQVNVVCVVPAFLYALHEYLQETNQFHLLTSIRQILFGGEACRVARIASLSSAFSQSSLSIDLINIYGPTEVSFWSTYHRITPDDLNQSSIPIGLPLSHYRCYVLNEHLSPISDKTIGELYIGGRGVFPGYFGDDERVRALNSHVLVRLPFDEGLCYRTGDLCRLSEGGEIVYCGRSDHQVKLRGQRIEVAEIEECLLRVEGVTNCVVIKQSNVRNQEDFLVAFIQSRHSDDLKIRERCLSQCRESLPTHLIPSVIKVLDQFPLNVNGKIDRQQLPDVSDLFNETVDEILPRNELEKEIHRYWSDLFPNGRISIQSDFFSIGGDSILAMKLLSRLKLTFEIDALTITDLFTATTIESQATLVEQMKQSSLLPRRIPLSRSGKSRAVASHAQQRIYLDEQLRFSENTADILSVYTITIGTQIDEGHLDEDRLKTSLDQLIARHEILRTTYHWNAELGILEQLVHSNLEYERYHWCINESNMTEFVHRRFNLNEGPLIRCHLQMNEKNEITSVIICIHHIAFDGTSISIFCSELQSLYNEQILPRLAIQYLDYTLQVDQLPNDHDESHRHFWTNLLLGYRNDALFLPVDSSRLSGRNRTGAAGVLHYTFSPLLVSRMKSHRESHQLTIFMQFLTIYQMFLARLTNQWDICVGSVNANRSQSELIGFFVNTLPYRIQISPTEDTFETLSARVKKLSLDVLEHANYPYDQIVQLYRTMEKSNSTKSLFQTLFLYEDMNELTNYLHFSPSSIRTSEYPIDDSSTIFDLQLRLRQQQEQLHLSFIYAKDLFARTTIEQILDRFIHFVEQLFVNNLSSLAISQYSLVLPHEQTLIDQLRYTQTDYGPTTTIPQAILATSHKLYHTQQPAIVLDEQQITYAQLLHRAQALATHLRVVHDIQVGDIIAQCVERSIEMSVGMVGIMLTGAIYCPLNPGDPLERLLTIVKETRARVILTHSLTEHKFSDPVTVNIPDDDHLYSSGEELPPVCVDPRSVAFLINTSGSTGKPKSVQLTHENFFNTFHGYRTVGFACIPHYRLLQIAGCSFDLHVVECLAPLIHGSTCVMLKPNGNLDLAYVASTIARHQVNNVAFVPSFLYALFEYLQRTNQFDLLRSMRQIVFGGEACHVARIATIAAVFSRPPLSIELLNAYGPAETCFSTTYHRLRQEDLDANSIPIGVPIPNNRCYILDEYLSPVPVNMLGELYIGGRGVFPGYFGDDERVRALNSHVLVRLPFDEGLCYRTGDLCRLSESGEIVYCGRSDHQVKLRGQRIEVAEIEECLLRVEGVTNCVVIKQSNVRNQEDFLVAFIQSRHSDDLKIRERCLYQCREELPSYMIPSVVKVLDHLPLNANDKVDRQQLPAVDFREDDANEKENLIPRCELERLVYMEWCHILGVSKLPLKADFFRCGGNSLMLMRLLSAYQAGGLINDARPVRIVTLFEQTTIGEHVKLLELPQGNPKERWQSLGVKEAIASSAQQRIWLDEQIRFSQGDSAAMYNVVIPLVIGKNNERVSMTRLHDALIALIDKHQILRTRVANEVTDKGGVIQQYVNSTSESFKDGLISQQVCSNSEQISNALISQVTKHLFSITAGHVFHCHILRCHSSLNEENLSEGDLIVFNFHHIAFDGSSRSIFLRDLQHAYDDPHTFSLTNADNEFQYIDYSIHEWNLLLDPSPHSLMNKARDYWKSTLKDCIAHRLFSPIASATFNRKTNIGGNYSLILSMDLSSMLISLALSNNLTLFQVFMSSYQLFLHKMTHQIDICVGGVTENRYRSELEPLIGMFVNVLPYRTKIDMNENLSRTDFLLRVQRLCLDVLEHGYLPFQDIVQLHRDPEQQYALPFFQTLLLLETFKSNEILCSLAEVPCQMIEPPISVAKYDLSLVVQHDLITNEMRCRWEYCNEFFDDTSIIDFSDRFIVFLTQMMNEGKGDLHILLPHEQQILHVLNDTHVDFGDTSSLCIAAVFDDHAQRHPEHICVTLDDTRLTYGQVRDYSNQLADYLLEQCGVQPGDIVMQCVQRSINMLIGILAILKARATYCPLNPDHPANRHADLIDVTNARFVICDHRTHTAFAWTATHHRPMSLINISTTLLPKCSSSIRQRNRGDNRAYIIFTSGSTGKPKIVPVRHENFFACIRACQHLNIFGSRQETVLQVSQCSFDLHVFEILGCMVTGGTLIMLKPFGNMDMDYLSQTIARQRVTWVLLTPTVTALLLEFAQNNRQSFHRLHSLQTLASAGEALVPNTLIELREYLSPQAQIYNLYGPAECTLLATYHLVTDTDLNSNLVPIGVPLSNYTCHILDEYLSPVPLNTLGELYIGGPGVFSGYLGDDVRIQESNKNVLVCLPGHDPEDLFYRTGDLCRLSSDGKIIYTGRTDQQVKIRGQRLELGEVEAALIDADVTCCAVVKHVDEVTNEEYLAAYIQAKESIPSIEYDKIQQRLLTHCQQRLPAFMIPTAWLIMPKLPLTSSDKIDRKQLPKINRTPLPINISSDTSSTKQEIPLGGSSLEDQVREIFSRALNMTLDKSAVDQSLAQLGGTSLTAMTIVTLVRERIHKSMDIGMLFAHPTITQLTNKLIQFQQVNKDTIIDLEPLEKFHSMTNDCHAVSFPSIRMETISVILLIYYSIYPLWASLKIIEIFSIQNSFFQNNPSGTYRQFWLSSIVQFTLLLFLIPFIQLTVYLLCKWLLLGRVNAGQYRLYSWHYYCHWFVHRLWLLNSPLLTVLLGTPFYNFYLRLCGARIGRDVHINTTLIDTPDLLSIADQTYVANGVILASLSYNQNDYQLDPVHIDRNCSIETRSVLQHGAYLGEHVLVKSMSFVNGKIPSDSTVDGTTVELNNRRSDKDDLKTNLSLNWMQVIYQSLSILLISILQIVIPSTAFATYRYLFPQISTIYFSLYLPILWIITLLCNVITCSIILRFLIGHVRNEVTHTVNSWHFLHQFWFRQLVVNTFGNSFSLFNAYHRLYPVLLRWFGARLGTDADIFDFGLLLSGPSNLITAGNGLTTNSSCIIAPLNVIDGKCTTRQIHIGNEVMLANEVTIDGGSFLPDRCLIGSMTRTNGTEQLTKNSIVLGVPARELPISNLAAAIPEKQSLRSLPLCTRIWRIFNESFLQTVLVIVLNKMLVAACGVGFIVYFFLDYFACRLTVTNIFLLLPALYILFMILFSIVLCLSYRICNSDIWQRGNYPFEKMLTWRRHLIWAIMADYYTFVGTFLGGTQWLVFLFRACGAQIGRNVLISDFHNLIDLQFITLRDGVRTHGTSIVQCHTFEHRLFQLAPSEIGEDSVLDHFSVTFPDCVLEGNNRVYPCTLILKGDRLPKGTAWKGNPPIQQT